MNPTIIKAKLVHGKNILLRNAEVGDAKFILSLRLDPAKSKYLSVTSPRLEDQINWLHSYEKTNDQAYFIVCDKSMNRLGCIRLYDPIGFSYCWGSWLMINGLSPLVSVESALLVYAYGKYLRFNEARIEVRKENRHVWSFHENLFSAQRVCESEADYFYTLKHDEIETSLKKYSKLLAMPLSVFH